ncbi:glutaminyl-peptide cyclotransferase [Streptomyces polyrhachis]|uniref:Glutaminyl-peptide cyclotransferase n=1 Tax=Streptomyces polyrhachis TaxID=1282885 RepID=A0ABW2GMQ2_9ACTN
MPDTGNAPAPQTSEHRTSAPPSPQRLRAEVLETLPHDRTAFTQGLELHEGVLYEGTGLAGRSVVTTGAPGAAPDRRTELPREFFGEGITLVGDALWQLTWRNGVAIERDASTLAERRRVRYYGEGWGLCHQPSQQRLVMSDGSSTLTFRDPRTFQETGRVRVTEAGRPLTQLNELECTADGAVYANIWQTDRIARIDPATGAVTATIDAAALHSQSGAPAADVLNGIAAIPATDEFLLTGKLWPTLYRVRFVPAD